MKRNDTIVLFNILSVLLTFMLQAQDVYLNEIRANDAGTDTSEFVEIIGPTGTDITGYTIEHFNGSNGASLFSFTFPSGAIIPDDGYIDDLGRSIGFLVVKNTNHNVANFDYEWGTTSMQNGPDGIEFRDGFGTRIQALTWNGLGSLTGGTPAWRNVGSDDSGDNSLSAPDGVQESLQNVWSSEVGTPGDININQLSGDIHLPVELTSFTAIGGDGRVSLKWVTQSEIDNQGFYLYRSNDKVGTYNQLSDLIRGAGNSSSQITYIYLDESVFNGNTYWYKLIDVDVNGVRTEHPVVSAVPHISSTDLGVVDNSELPKEFALKGNYPNPFNPETTISFDIPETANELVNVNLSIYNMLGQKITTLLNEPLAANSYEVKWFGKDNNGQTMPSGIYLYLLKTENFISSHKMMLIK